MRHAAGVNVQPQGVAIAPNLIVIGPYDTTVAGQARIWPLSLPLSVLQFASAFLYSMYACSSMPRKGGVGTRGEWPEKS